MKRFFWRTVTVIGVKLRTARFDTVAHNVEVKTSYMSPDVHEPRRRACKHGDRRAVVRLKTFV